MVVLILRHHCHTINQSIVALDRTCDQNLIETPSSLTMFFVVVLAQRCTTPPRRVRILGVGGVVLVREQQMTSAPASAIALGLKLQYMAFKMIETNLGVALQIFHFFHHSV